MYELRMVKEILNIFPLSPVHLLFSPPPSPLPIVFGFKFFIYPAGKLKVKFLFRMEVLAPEKKTHEENEDLQQYPQKPASCKKMLRNCCLIKRIFAWKSLSSKGTFSIENFSVGEIVVLPRILNF